MSEPKLTAEQRMIAHAAAAVAEITRVRDEAIKAINAKKAADYLARATCIDLAMISKAVGLPEDGLVEPPEVIATVQDVVRERDEARADLDKCAQVGWYELVEAERRRANEANSAAHALAEERTRAVVRAEKVERDLKEARREVETALARAASDREYAQAEREAREKAERERAELARRLREAEERQEQESEELEEPDPRASRDRSRFSMQEDLFLCDVGRLVKRAPRVDWRNILQQALEAMDVQP